jgi:DNA polymerase III subunit epsilon
MDGTAGPYDQGMSLPHVIVAFDVETTGKNPTSDQVIELSIIRHGPEPAQYFKRFKPTVAVTPGAFKVHGISDEDLAQEPPFADQADRIESLLLSADTLVGYNVSFDIRFIESEFSRLGRKLDLWSKRVVDPLRIWHSMEPRKLENAHQRFVGGALESAHSAEADTRAVLDVLSGMRESFHLQEASWDELALLTSPDRLLWIGPSSHFRWEAGHVVFGFGKYESRPLFDVASEDPKYLRWIQGGQFPAHAQNLCKGALAGLSREQFHEKIAAHFGTPAEQPVDQAQLAEA